MSDDWRGCRRFHTVASPGPSNEEGLSVGFGASHASARKRPCGSRMEVVRRRPCLGSVERLVGARTLIKIGSARACQNLGWASWGGHGRIVDHINRSCERIPGRRLSVHSHCGTTALGTLKQNWWTGTGTLAGCWKELLSLSP